MDDQKIPVCVLAADDTDVYVCRIKYKVAWLRVAPCDIRAIAVLGCRAAAAPRIVAAIGGVVECPIDESATI